MIMGSPKVQATGQNSLLCSKTRIWLPLAFKKNPGPTVASERLTYPLQNKVYLLTLTLALGYREI